MPQFSNETEISSGSLFIFNFFYSLWVFLNRVVCSIVVFSCWLFFFSYLIMVFFCAQYGSDFGGTAIWKIGITRAEEAHWGFERDTGWFSFQIYLSWVSVYSELCEPSSLRVPVHIVVLQGQHKDLATKFFEERAALKAKQKRYQGTSSKVKY